MKIRTRVPFAAWMTLSSIAWSATPASAQTASPIIRQLTHVDWTWSYGRTAAGDFDNDCNIDVADQNDVFVDVLFAPGVYPRAFYATTRQPALGASSCAAESTAPRSLRIRARTAPAVVSLRPTRAAKLR